ncbi:hypothetical protein HYV84_00830 [Candidatus Woesearchaeota archaeon]|nr:hypothetical protein [Candidatus Woesearchaeota archaeon]
MPREKSEYFLYAVLGVLAIVLLYSFGSAFFGNATNKQDANRFPQSNVELPKTASSSPFGPKTIGTTGQGDVEIQLSPQKPEGTQLSVGIAVNTHSVDLSPFDLKEITTLQFNGKSINPSEAPGIEGHHASGTLLFTGVDGIGKEFTITIKGIPQITDREFTWR